MKVLVTGANGYLGRGIVRALLNRGNQVVAVDVNTENVDERAARISCNLFEVDDPYLFFGKPDVMLHLAWKDGFVHYSSAHIEDLPMHCLFLEKMCASDISMISVMGSMHEIGFYEGSIDEKTPCNPLSYYGVAKNALREMLVIMAKENDKPIQWLRAFYIVGSHSFGSSIFSKISLAAERGERFFPFTTGENQFDFLDYDVFCEMVACTVMQRDILGVINICSGRPEKLAYRVERFIKENNYNIKLQYGMFPERKYDSKAVWGNDEKISKIMQNYSYIHSCKLGDQNVSEQNSTQSFGSRI